MSENGRMAARSIVLVVLLAWSLPVVASERQSRFTFSRKAMGVQFTIVLYASEKSQANTAAGAALDRITALDIICSDYSPTSELMKLCARAQPGRAESISEDLARVLARSQQLARRTNGAFDVTVGPLTKLWRRTRRRKVLPSARRLLEARRAVGHAHLQVDRDGRQVTFARTGMRLDLGGIAKGYAVDRAIEILARHGIKRAMVDGSGDIAVGDPPPGRSGWQVAVASLKNPDATPTRVLDLVNTAVATSGDAYQSVTINGRRYSHILDPRTGLGLSVSSSVTVVAPDAATADGLASAISVMGPVAGIELAERTRGVQAMFVMRIDGRHRVRSTTGWSDRLRIRRP